MMIINNRVCGISFATVQINTNKNIADTASTNMRRKNHRIRKDIAVIAILYRWQQCIWAIPTEPSGDRVRNHSIIE